MTKINLSKKQLKAACESMVLIEEDFMDDIKKEAKISIKDWVNMRVRVCRLAKR